jgi:hypothetical protein
MKKLFIIFILIVPVVYSFAQYKEYAPERRPLNNMAVNICGDASILSLHYERLLFLNPNLFIAGKLGIGLDEPTIRHLFGYMSPPENYFITMPHHLTLNLGKKRHFFEFGLGGSLILQGSGDHYVFYPVAGYRLQPLKTNRIYLRFYGTQPISGNEDIKDQFTPWGSSIGISF